MIHIFSSVRPNQNSRLPIRIFEVKFWKCFQNYHPSFLRMKLFEEAFQFLEHTSEEAFHFVKIYPKSSPRYVHTFVKHSEWQHNFFRGIPYNSSVVKIKVVGMCVILHARRSNWSAWGTATRYILPSITHVISKHPTIKVLWSQTYKHKFCAKHMVALIHMVHVTK